MEIDGRKGALYTEPLVQPETEAQKKVLGAHRASVRLIFLPIYHRICCNA